MILVTGATGFIGRRFIRRLLQAYDRSEILCLTYADATSPLEQSGHAVLDELGVKSIPIDLLTKQGFENIPRSPNIVFHIASNTDTGSRGHAINTIGTMNLLEAIRPLGPNARFIFTSTISVSDHRVNPNVAGDEESALLRPYSDYGRKKLKAEALLKNASATDGFSLTILRVCAVYGNGTRKNGLYDSLVRFARRDSPLARINYPGEMTMMHVDDIADILVRLSHLPIDHAPRTVLAHAEVLSIHEMCAAIYAALGKPFRPIVLPRWFWSIVQAGSRIIYAIEPIVPHNVYNALWQLTLLANNGYNNVSVRLRGLLPEKTTYKSFSEFAKDLL